jgi:hypothetical protein
MKKQVSTDQTEENISEVLHLLAETPDRLKKLSRSLSNKKLHEPLGKGERSFIETLAHILNCEVITAESIYLALMLKEPVMPRFHAERNLGKLLQLDQMPFEELIAYFKFRRAVLMRVLGSLNDKQWSRVIREEGKQRKESVYWRARGQALHELEHVLDLERKLSKKS